jgi:hypothetical protein
MKLKPRATKHKFYEEVFAIKKQHQFISNAQLGRMVGLSGQRVGWILRNYMQDTPEINQQHCDHDKELDAILDELDELMKLG